MAERKGGLSFTILACGCRKVQSVARTFVEQVTFCVVLQWCYSGVTVVLQWCKSCHPVQKAMAAC